MNEVLQKLHSFPPQPPPQQPLSAPEYDKQIRSLLQYLNQISASKLTGGVSPEADLLDVLDPSIHTVSYLFVLVARIQASQPKVAAETVSAALLPTGRLWPRLIQFLENFDPVQVRYAGHEWRKVIEILGRGAQAASKSILAIRPIKNAMLRLDPSSSTFTSTHLLFACLCLESRSYRSALPILDNSIYHFPGTQDKATLQKSQQLLCAEHRSSSTYITVSSGLSAKLVYRDHLEYFLYGAMIYMGLKKWAKALTFLEVVIVAPTNNVASMIMVEAYKKWVLVGLLETGRLLPMPTTTNNHVAKAYRSLARAYDALAEIFQSGDAVKLRAEVEVGQQIWHNDNNTGLVLQVFDAFRRFSVLKLENTYAALSIPEIARRTFSDASDLAETESYIMSLIASGDLRATLSQSPAASGHSTLRFGSSSAGTPLARSELELQQELAVQTNHLMNITKHIQENDKRMELSKEYIDYLRKVKKSKEAEGKDGGSHMDNVNEYDVDEDMMGDLR